MFNGSKRHQYEISLVFKEVSGGNGKLVAAASIVKQQLDGKNNHSLPRYLQRYTTPYTTAKAIDVDLERNNPASRFIARVEAVRQFLHKAKPRDSITIKTNDLPFLDIAFARDPAASEAIESWNNFTEQFNDGPGAEISVVFADSPLSSFDIAKRLLDFRINKIGKGTAERGKPGNGHLQKPSWVYQ